MAHATVYDCCSGVRTPYVLHERTPVNHISKVADAITFPARTAIGVARLGLSTSLRVVGWAVEQAGGPPRRARVDLPARHRAAGRRAAAGA